MPGARFKSLLMSLAPDTANGTMGTGTIDGHWCSFVQVGSRRRNHYNIIIKKKTKNGNER
jgi:hypothetical protein